MKTEWEIKEIDKSKLSFLKEKLNLPELVVKLLINRGIETYEDAQYFFYPIRNYMRNPESLSGVSKAVDLIIEAIQQRKRIVVHGDYDVDGITATAVAVLGMRFLNTYVRGYIPERENGYGLNIVTGKQIGRAHV